jgi:ATP-dependent Lon protease
MSKKNDKNYSKRRVTRSMLSSNTDDNVSDSSDTEVDVIDSNIKETPPMRPLIMILSSQPMDGGDGKNDKRDKKDRHDKKRDEREDENQSKKKRNHDKDDENREDGSKKKKTYKPRTHSFDDDEGDDDNPFRQEDDITGFLPFLLGGGIGGQKASKQNHLRKRIVKSGMSEKDKQYVLNRLNNVDVEKEKATEWFESLLKIPFGKLAETPIKMTDEKTDINKYFDRVYEKLDLAVYGMDKVKEDIVNYVAQFISTDNKSSPRVIGLCGSAGIGKTVIIRRGLAEVLNRPMKTISMGGIRDSATFVGFEYSYAGSRYGAISQCLMDAEVMNPIIFMDELDKISSTHDGIDIQNVLIHLTDPVQNMGFQDKYFAGVNIDLSKVIFVFAFNDINLISPILKDRINIFHVPDPSLESKVIIGKNYLVREISPNVGFKETDIVFSEDIVRYIIKTHCKGDKGVRGLKKCIETIILKINTARFLGSRLKYKQLKDINFPLTLTEKMVNELIPIEKSPDDDIISRMYL